MAPGTTIGAAHPVALGPGGPVGLPEEYRRKMVEDARTRLEAVARIRGRDETFAREAVAESKTLGAEEALSRRVADLLARDEADLFRQLAGRQVKLGPREVTLSPESPPLRREPGAVVRFLHALAHPEVAYLLLLLGIYALIFELSSPGVGVAGALGAVALIMALYSLHLLEANLAALALILLGAGLALAEHFFPAHGLLLGSGAVAFLAGSLLLIQSPFLPRLGLPALVPALALFLGGAWALRAGWRAHRKPVATGAEGMIGLEGVAVEDLNLSGLVRVRGELWKAVADRPVKAGERVRVRRVEGLSLEVERAEEGEGSLG
jgi:membrane-bound serine protease (ClpP class)